MRSELLECINALEELPFGGWRDGQGLDAPRMVKQISTVADRRRE
jgi:hypothetical protein